MKNVIRYTHNEQEVCLMAQSISTVQFEQCAGSDISATVSFVGEPDASATFEDPFVIAQLRALTALTINSFAVRAGTSLNMFPFNAVSCVMYNDVIGEDEEHAKVILNSGLTFGLDKGECDMFRMNYGLWLDRHCI